MLMSREIFTLELPIIANEIASDRAPPAAVAQLALTSEPEETTAAPDIPQPADEQEFVPTNATYLKDTPPEPDAAISIENISAPHPEAPIPETVSSAGEPTGTSSIEAISFDMPAPQKNTRTGIPAKTSYESLAAAVVGWGNGDENAGYRQGNSTVP